MSQSPINNSRHVQFAGSGPAAVLKLPEKRPYKFANWNVRSLNKTGNSEILCRELDKYDIDFAVITEARVRGDGNKDIQFEKSRYKLYYSGDPNFATHGVAIAVRAMHNDCVAYFEPISSRLAILELNGLVKCTIVAAYAPTECDIAATKDSFYESLQQALTRVGTNGLTLVIGDLNAEIGSDRTGWEDVMGRFGHGQMNDNGLRLCSFAQHSSLSISNSWFQHKPSHRITWESNDHKTKKQLDYFLISRRFASSVHDVRVNRAADIGSDHSMVVCKLKLRLKAGKRRPPLKRYDLNALSVDAVRDNFLLKLNNRFGILTDPTLGLEDSYSNFKNAVNGAVEDSCPVIRTLTAPWISPATLTLVDKRKAAKNVDKRRYNFLHREIGRRLREDKEQWWNQQASELEAAANKGDSLNLFRKVNQIAKKRATISETIVDKDGNLLRSKEEKLARWAEYFHDLLNRDDPPELHNSLDDPPHATDTNIVADPPSKAEIEKAIHCLKNRKAPGHDGIFAESLKAGGGVVVDALCDLFAEMWQTESFPSDWKTGIITPVYKKSDPKTCGNYRGITLLSVVGKIFSSIIRQRISANRESNCREQQAGFRPGRGCSDNIFNLRQILTRRIRYGKPFVAVFIDFAAAFDSVHRASMFKALLQEGTPEKIVDILRSLYSGSTSYVRVYNEPTQLFDIKTGVRQGCILSPMLFNVIIDFVMRKALSNVEGIEIGTDLSVTDLAYADDICIFAETPALAEHALELVDAAATKFGLVISAPKSKILSHGHQHPTVRLRGLPLEVVDNFVYLGCKINTTETASSVDIRGRIGKATAIFAKLRPQLWSQRHISLRTKMRVFNAMVIPTLLYSCESWAIKADDLAKLEVFQMSCLRAILGVSRLQHLRNVNIRETCCNQPLIDDIIRKYRIRWAGHVWRMPDSRLPIKIFNSVPPRNWRVARNAPRKQWVDALRKDFNRVHFNIGDAQEAAQNRDQYRGLARDIGAATSWNGNSLPYQR